MYVCIIKILISFKKIKNKINNISCSSINNNSKNNSSNNSNDNICVCMYVCMYVCIDV